MQIAKEWIFTNELKPLAELQHMSVSLICPILSFHEPMSKQYFHDIHSISKKYTYLLSRDDVSVLVAEVVVEVEVVVEAEHILTTVNFLAL